MPSTPLPTFELDNLDAQQSKKGSSSSSDAGDAIAPVNLTVPPGYDPGSRRSSGLLSLAPASINKVRDDGKIELREEDAPEKLGFAFSSWKKWGILTVIFLVQVSMNFNTSIYGNGIVGMAEEFGKSKQHIRIGQMVFLIAYGFGSELWAPWSEEWGRKPVLQASLFLVNLTQIPCALAKRFDIIIAFRLLGGLCSAGGSVTLGMVADMWEPHAQGYAVNFVVLSSVAGSVVGPVAGGFVEQYLHWRWVFWIQAILGGVAQLVHLFVVPETRTSIMLDREARRRRKSGEQANVYGPRELKTDRLTVKDVLTIWYRPFEMMAREPIVSLLSLFSGFSDSLIFTFLSSYPYVFGQWGFGTIAIGLTFLPLLIGYFLAWASFLPFIYRDTKILSKNPEGLPAERRLFWLLFVAPLEFLGLIGFAFTSFGPGITRHWLLPMFFSTWIAIANFAIYMATIDYMIAAYGPYSASATGGNALARDLLAGVAAMYSAPFYENMAKGTKWTLAAPSAILAALAAVVTVPIYFFYFNGEKVRERSKFAMTLESERKDRRQSVATIGGPDAGGSNA